MISSDKLCVKWEDFQTNISRSLREIREDQEFSDVTLVCEGNMKIEAHKVILASGSTFFENILDRSPGDHLHPVKLSHCGQAALVRGGTGVTEC